MNICKRNAIFVFEMPVLKTKCSFVTHLQFDFFVLLTCYDKSGTPKEGQFPLEFFVIRESTPVFKMGIGGWRHSFVVLSFEKSGL